MTEKFNKISRDLVKKIEVLPNVSEIRTIKHGFDEFAILFGIKKVVRSKYWQSFEEGKAPNEYIRKQMRRLTVYANEGNIAKYNFMCQVLLKHSISYRLLAYNRVQPKWYLLSLGKLKGQWRELTHICRTNDGNVKFKRQWIDKKPGDAARPLGVPTVAWRAYSYMRMDLLERWFKAQGKLAPWQHGGRSGVGVLSAWKALIPKITKSKYIFEFDLKGFFDNVSHEKILEIIKPMGSSWGSWIQKMLISQPASYGLPEKQPYREMFDASREYQTHFNRFGKTLYWQVVKSESQKESEELWRRYEEDDKKYGEFPTRPMVINGKEYFIIRTDTLSQASLGRARDNWHNLNQPGKGVPQGLGSSPFLSTLLTDRYLSDLSENIIMYMDDGILFANSAEEMRSLKMKLLKGLNEMRISIAPEKSFDVRIEGQWLSELKFLGLVYDSETNTMRSKTRAGTELRFPLLNSWKEIQKVAPGINDMMSESYWKVKLNKLVNHTAHEAALAHGFLGAMISESMIPITEEEYSRRYEIARTKILTGQGKAADEIRASATDKCFIWKFQDLWPIDSLQVQVTDPLEINLTAMSSIACIKFLKATKRDPLAFLRTKAAKSSRLGRKVLLKKA